MIAAILTGLAIVTLGVGGCIFIYNALVSRQLEAENAWAHIDVQLKRRYELIPNLIEVVKGYAGHEEATLAKVAQARSTAMGLSGRADLAQAENALAGPLRNLFLLAEAYPQIKANQQFQQLHAELAGTESRISFARQYYNDTAAQYNTLLNRFPSNVLAGLLGFKPAEFFRLAADEATVPGVK
jgi:LemA protein